eukprot:366553-Chlamydomonas_euryale.AAC.18
MGSNWQQSVGEHAPEGRRGGRPMWTRHLPHICQIFTFTYLQPAPAPANRANHDHVVGVAAQSTHPTPFNPQLHTSCIYPRPHLPNSRIRIISSTSGAMLPRYTFVVKGSPLSKLPPPPMLSSGGRSPMLRVQMQESVGSGNVGPWRGGGRGGEGAKAAHAAAIGLGQRCAAGKDEGDGEEVKGIEDGGRGRRCGEDEGHAVPDTTCGSPAPHNLRQPSPTQPAAAQPHTTCGSPAPHNLRQPSPTQPAAAQPHTTCGSPAPHNLRQSSLSLHVAAQLHTTCGSPAPHYLRQPSPTQPAGLADWLPLSLAFTPRSPTQRRALEPRIPPPTHAPPHPARPHGHSPPRPARPHRHVPPHPARPHRHAPPHPNRPHRDALRATAPNVALAQQPHALLLGFLLLLQLFHHHVDRSGLVLLLRLCGRLEHRLCDISGQAR